MFVHRDRPEPKLIVRQQISRETQQQRQHQQEYATTQLNSRGFL
jgi:hypothetical protein